MTTPSGAAELADIISDIRDGITDIEITAEVIGNGIRFVLDQLPGYVADGLRVTLADLQRLSAEKIAELRDLLAHVGDPGALESAGRTWAFEIGGTVSGLAGFATLNGIGADDHWTGVAADAYRNTLPAQNGALTAVKAAADEVDATLTELSNAIVTFWSTVGIAMVTLIAALFAASPVAATIFGAPFAGGFALAAFVAFGVLVTSALSALTAIVTNSATRSGELERRLSNDSAFPGGDWPRSTTPISGDGSITDGDDTDWHLK